MFTQRRPLGLKIVIITAVLNSLVATVHFILLSRGILKPLGLTENLSILATTALLVAIIPTVVGAYGLYKRKVLGLGLFTMGSGAFLSLAVLMLLFSLGTGKTQFMFWVAIYLIVYNILVNFYTWSLVHYLRDY